MVRYIAGMSRDGRAARRLDDMSVLLTHEQARSGASCVHRTDQSVKRRVNRPAPRHTFDQSNGALGGRQGHDGGEGGGNGFHGLPHHR
jgi:hypothetical protein